MILNWALLEIQKTIKQSIQLLLVNYKNVEFTKLEIIPI